jgi:phospholipase/lecithinase/hemolysin
MRDIRSWAPLAASALALATALAIPGCGGGGSDTTPAVAITSVKVMGDSLADSGTFGFKFTVQATNANGIDLKTPRVYPELVANSYGVTSLCNVYTFTGTTFVANPTQTGCTNSAVGGGRINNYTAPTSPQSIPLQLSNASAAGNYTAGDLLIVDGGGNDAADLIGAYLKAPSDSAASYAALLGTLLPPATVNAALTGGANGLAGVGATYLTALADKFYDSIKTSALDKGAQRVVVLNMPGITNTPRFQMVLDSIAAAYGGGAAGAAARAQSEALFKSWIVAFNTELAAKFSGNANVVLVDFYTSFNDQVAAPAQFGLTNATVPACPITGVGSDGLPTYTFATCTDAALSAMTPPAGASGGADWWKTYAFSDSFHPTPQAHKNLAQLISRSLLQAGWL